MGTQFCQGCNNICSDGTSLGENNLTQKQNPPITNITNPYFFNNNKTITSINDPKNNNESFINNNNNKMEVYNTTMNNHLPSEEEQKLSKLYSKNPYINSNNNYNSSYSNAFTGEIDKEKEDLSARKITSLFRKLLTLKKIAHLTISKELSYISSSEFIIGLDKDKLNLNLAPEDTCIYLGNKFNEKKDGLGLEIFNNVNAKYVGNFRNGKRVNLGKFSVNNDVNDYIYCGFIQGIYAFGYGWMTDKKNLKDYEGMWENSMKSGYGIEKYGDNSEYRGCFSNGKREGIGYYQWNEDNSSYEGEWKENKLNGFGIYKFKDGSEYRGHWKKSRLHGFGMFIYPGIKQYYGFFQKDRRAGFGIGVWLKEKKAFIGFWKDNDINGYGKFIVNNKIQYGLWKGGKSIQKFKKKEFFNKINEEKIGFFKYFQMDDYNNILNLIN